MDARDNKNLKPYEKEPCNHCGVYKSFQGHDGCLGTLDGLMNACCNHGGKGSGAFVQFYDGFSISGEDALIIQEVLKRNRSGRTEMEKLQYLAGNVKWTAEDINER